MYRAAYHFRAKKVIVVSAYRKPGAKSEGRHAEGKAIDFKLNNTSASALAAYLRTLSRVEWVSTRTPTPSTFTSMFATRATTGSTRSPPGRSWRERPLGGGGMAKRDEAYSPNEDWPEGTAHPASLQSGALNPSAPDESP